MKNVLSSLLVLLAIGFNSCDSAKKSTEKTTGTNEKVMEKANKSNTQVLANGSSLSEGIVTGKYREESCEFLIVSSKDGEEIILHPANLGDEFKEDGLKVKVQYRPTRQPNTDGCHKGLFIQVEEISKI